MYETKKKQKSIMNKFELRIKWRHCGTTCYHTREVSWSEAKLLLKYGYNGNVSKATLHFNGRNRELWINYTER